MTERVTKSERIEYLDVLRVFAIFAVLLIHISAEKWSKIDLDTYEWQVFTIIDSINRWGVPVFVMISGALFLDRDIPVSRIYTKYILRLVTAFILWSGIYVLATGSSDENRILTFIHGHFHLWFIPMIIGLYMCLPLLRPVAERKDRTEYFLVLAFIFAFVIPEAMTLVSDFGSDQLKEIADALYYNVDKASLNMVMGYPGYFVLGYALGKADLSKRTRMVIYILGLAGFIATIALTRAASMTAGSACKHYFDYLTVNVLFESAAVFTWFRYRNYRSRQFAKLARRLSDYSFGVYLVHVLVLDQLKQHYGLSAMSFNDPVQGVATIFAITVIVSFLISAVLNHIPVIRKYLV